MSNAAVGSVITLRDGAFGNFQAEVVAREGDKLRVRVQIFGKPTEVVVDDHDSYGTLDPPSAGCPFQPGDTVFDHGGTSGSTLRIVGVLESAKKAECVDAQGAAATRSFDSISLVAPHRRDVLPDYLASLRHKYRWYQGPLNRWAAVQLAQHAWDPHHPALTPGTSTGLVEAFHALEEGLWAEATAELAREEAELKAQFEPLSPEQRVARWQETWLAWAGTPQTSGDIAARLEKRSDHWLPHSADTSLPVRILGNSPEDSRASARSDIRHQLVERLQRRSFDPEGLAEPTPREPRAIEDDRAYLDWRARTGAESGAALAARAAEAYEEASAQLPAVRERVLRDLGLRVPEDVAVGRAFFEMVRDLCELEGEPYLRQQLVHRQELSPGYLLDLFRRESDDPQRRGDPPEMIEVMAGSTDGFHWGLWYDDPRYLPSFVVSRHKDTSAGQDGTTLLATMLDHLGVEEERQHEADVSDWRTTWRFERRLLREHAHALQPAEAHARAADDPHRCPWPRTKRLTDGPGIVAPPELVDDLPEDLTDDTMSRDRAERLLEQGRASLTAGRPVLALAVARVLHYYGSLIEEQSEAITALLVESYEALGRAALVDAARRVRAPRPPRR